MDGRWNFFNGPFASWTQQRTAQPSEPLFKGPNRAWKVHTAISSAPGKGTLSIGTYFIGKNVRQSCSKNDSGE
ncbi:hypothetical protein GCM10025857_23360 [Alicyclobacillus contaminans]|nr:hypothetical protein GCM10025857_23360 [Alicyclobacillus contaminans]